MESSNLNEIKRRTIRCYAFQVPYILLVASLGGIGILVILIAFLNLMVCGIYVGKSFNKTLKELAPNKYNDLYEPYIDKSYKVFAFAFFKKNAEDTDDVKKLRKYTRLNYLLTAIIFFTPPFVSFSRVFI